ncbi:TPA: hypothetical protein ACNGY8_003904 [Klebsiella michiganensis]
MHNKYLIENFKEEARALACEVKRLQVITEKNPVCSEAAELLASAKNRLNVLAHMAEQAGENMKSEAEAEAAGIIRPKYKPSRTISAGERAKRQAVRRGATLYRGAI